MNNTCEKPEILSDLKRNIFDIVEIKVDSISLPKNTYNQSIFSDIITIMRNSYRDPNKMCNIKLFIIESGHEII